MPSREGVAPRTLCHAHAERGTLSECLFFFGIYLLLTRQLWCYQRRWRPMGQSPSKTKVPPTWNAVHRLMLSTHHLGRTHVPPFCVTPCPSFPGGIAACAAPPLPPLPPRGLGFVHVPLAQETMAWGGVGGDMRAVEAAGPFCRPICVCFLLTWALVPRLQGIFV